MTANDIPDQLPTATIAEHVDEFVNAETGKVLFVFADPKEKKFALSFNIQTALIVMRMCSKVIAQYQAAKKDGSLFPHGSLHAEDICTLEASVIESNDFRNCTAIQFEGAVAYFLHDETAEKLIELLSAAIDRHTTQGEKRQRLRKKHPSIIIPKGAGGIIK